MAYEKTNKLHIVAVVAVIRNNDGKYLVLKRRDDEVAYPGMYTFPGGKIEENDSIEETLVKEAEEEASLKLKSGKMLLKDKSFIRPDGQTVKSFSYLCTAEEPLNVKISSDFTDYKWISHKDLKAIPHVGIDEELRLADELYANGNPLEKFGTKSEKIEKQL
jgi:8-oxo-dGTP diphosphatase